ncbi:hypothetical protein DM01DRAFT_1380297 [Hesseltinella vesiculosa]|uniref:Cation/H+ exchanger transmembrane domain-containing protein n=1 Tax=Hesseltinella vesiculosa TaxID=101127 RepID=A0A1X2GTT8_9FUNG|nr:hypothetical protein DM01DRAFT_1380297 [Hesseltinella vesiculosa]
MLRYQCIVILLWLSFIGILCQSEKALRYNPDDPESVFAILEKGKVYRHNLLRRKQRLNDNLRYVHDFDTSHLYQLVEMQIDDFNAFETLMFDMLDIYGATVGQAINLPPAGTKGGPFYRLYDYRTPALRLTYDFQMAIKASHDKFRSTPWQQIQDWASSKDSANTHEQQQQQHDTDDGESIKALLNAMLQDVSDSADQLEQDMHQHSLKFASGHLETVLKVDDTSKQKMPSPNDGNHLHQDDIPGEDEPAADIPSIITLIDQDQNEYIMTRPADTTIIYEDMQFLHDVILILVVSFCLGLAFAMVGLPAFFGYILAGILTGPSGYNQIKELIQTETLAQLGVALIVFVLGLECSLDKLKSMYRIALGGASLIFLVTVSCFIMLGIVFGTTIKEAIFVGACISLSSTAVVVKVIPAEYMDHLYGLLVMQDVLLGFMLAMVPALSKSGIQVMRAMASVTLSFLIFAALCYTLVRFVIPMTPRLLHRWLPKRILNHLFSDLAGGSSRHELAVLGSLAICLLISTISERLGLGMELGCFAAGVVIRSSSSSPHHHHHPSSQLPLHEALLAVVTPVRDLFACLFFASIGLHVYPSFLASELVLLLTLTVAVIGFKYIVTAGVLLLFKFDMKACSTMSIALAQISEFVFVLASRAKQLQIISREVYYILLATTSLTLIATPLLWKLTHPQPSPLPDDLPQHHDDSNKFA